MAGRNTLAPKSDEDGWLFDTVKPGTIVCGKNNEKRRVISLPSSDSVEEPPKVPQILELTRSPVHTKSIANSTVQRSSPSRDLSPSVRRLNTKRRSSGVKQPLGVNLSFGNSPSTVRQFRRVSDKQQEISDCTAGLPPGMDENFAQKTLFSEPTSKEALLGRRAYSKAIGLACQETLATTWDQEKREAISRLAEAWSDLEMVDPEGLYHIVGSLCEKLQA
jgi:serine/threonine-protein kinase 24/25/MST4